MPPDKPNTTEEQKIKARKNLLFEADAPQTLTSTASGRPFKLYLRETPAAPLSSSVKAGLWGVGALVCLLFIASVVKLSNSKPRLSRSGGSATANAASADPKDQK